mgnify:CR=1 FL=1
MTAEHKYEMTISLQIVEHLGLNLYSNTSAVISEAVANAWDADAKTVEITLEKDCITIKDDGCGMDTDDINNKYLTVGYQKRHLVPITPMLNRKVMGRKGIGKLSLLSIAETIMFPDHCALRQSSVDNALMRIAHDIRLEYPFGAEPLPKLHIL